MIVVSPNTKPYKAIFDRKRQHGVNNFMVCASPTMSRMHVPLGVTGKGHVHICTVNSCNRLGIPIFVFPTPLSTIMILDWSVVLTGKRDMHASILCSNFLQQKSDLKYDSWDPSLHVSCLLIYPFLHLSSLPRFCIKLPLTISSKVERKKESFNSIHETNQLKLLASYKQHLTLPWNWCSYRVSRLITTILLHFYSLFWRAKNNYDQTTSWICTFLKLYCHKTGVKWLHTQDWQHNTAIRSSLYRIHNSI